MPKPLEIDERTLETKVRIASDDLDKGNLFSNVRLVSNGRYISQRLSGFCQLLEREFGLGYAVEEKARNYLGITESLASKKKEEELNLFLAYLLSGRIVDKLSKLIKYRATENDGQVDFASKSGRIVNDLLTTYCTDLNSKARESYIVRTETDIFYVTVDFFTRVKRVCEQKKEVLDRMRSELEKLKLPDEKAIMLETGTDGDGSSSGYLVAEAPEDRYSDLGGLEEQLTRVREVIELPLTKPQRFKELGVKMPKGCIFFGPPGTGKTMCARAIANETKSSFFYVPGPDLRRKYVGVGASIIRDLYTEAFEKRPSIVFIDEVDAILQGRGTDTGRYTEEQTNQMLICIDGFKKLEGIATIFATNRIDLLDEALLDRFSSRYIIEFPLPDEKAREQIFKIKLAKMKVGESVNPASLAERTAEANGRDIDDILTQAGIHAIKEEKDAVYAEDIEYGLRQEGF